ncbi:MAG: tetratricopeptide repeat protein [Gemmatimonadota bacterium]|nr:tetratricopeptide repeat protein [Gemmatimonadota bacterium]
MSIEALKQKARKHEQNEDWQKALDQYNKALAELAREEQVDIGLHNRVGDLYVRVGNLAQAVDHYEKAVELYREAYLPNNAIAVCKKVIRNVPTRHKAYLVIGQIRAEQGFLPDARTNFLTYAERMQHDGDLDESFRALIEFCDLAPEDVGVRITVADQMAAQGRESEAVDQLVVVHRHFTQLGDAAQAAEIEAKIASIDPDADVAALAEAAGFGDTGGEGMFGEISFAGDAFGDGPESDAESGFALGGALEEAAEDFVSAAGEEAQEVEVGLEGFDIASGVEEDESGDVEDFDVEAEPLPGFDDPGDEAAELPTIAFDDAEYEEEAEPLPTLAFDDDDDGEADAEPLPMLEVDFDDEEAVELPMLAFDDDAPGEGSGALPTMGFEDAADDLVDAAEAVQDAFEEGRAESVPEREPQIDASRFEDEPVSGSVQSAFGAQARPETKPEAPPEAGESPTGSDGVPEGGYVDLGAMILGGGKEKSTRFTVAYEEPSGDEDADFAKMLTQFKDKVSENLDSSDVRAHYDLGTAYKEMGLLDEAITSFQAALRASANHLPTYEMMGQTFIEMGQPEAAVRSLERALESANTIEDELVGIYYYLGRAYQELENTESAVDFYDRVFSLDINFADVTERLRELR